MTIRAQEDYFEGRFLDGKLMWVYPQGTPGPGYAVGHDGVLWRNGERVGYVLKVEFNREALGHWVHYRSWRGSPMDHHGFYQTWPGRAASREVPEGPV